MADVFISHASEDKATVAKPLAEALLARGYDVWLDKFVVKLGDSLPERIDDGLSSCRYAVVILSPHFVSKQWTKRELDGLVARETQEGAKRILPVWHEITAEAVAKFSLTLSSRLAVSTAAGMTEVVTAIIDVLGAPSRGEVSNLVADKSPDGGSDPAQRLSDAVARAREYLMPQPLSVAEAVVETIRRSFSEAGIRPQLAHVIPYLASPDAVYRVVGYLATQVAAAQGVDLRTWSLELAACFGREQRHALERHETRPLWQLLVAVGNVINQNPPEPDRSYLRDAMRDTGTFLHQNLQLDPGGQCKARLRKLLTAI